MINKSYAVANEIGNPTDEDMTLINNFALKPLAKEDVFCFSVILCDNDIDRDFERFDEKALITLKSLFVGKTGILNHSMKSEDQACRTYKTKIIYDDKKTTSDNQPYICLKAWCYTVRSEKNNSLIRDIESGIKKEVSISCSSKSRICSICGGNNCSHIPGRTYENKVCHKTITDIQDAYEWSFVAVPAQRNAGVTKSKKQKERNMENILKAIKSGEEITLKSTEIHRLCEYITSLEKQSEDGKLYRQGLEKLAKQHFAVAMPSLNEEQVDEILKSVSSETLEALSGELAKKTAKILPPISQLYTEKKEEKNLNQQFKF